MDIKFRSSTKMIALDFAARLDNEFSYSFSWQCCCPLPVAFALWQVFRLEPHSVRSGNIVLNVYQNLRSYLSLTSFLNFKLYHYSLTNILICMKIIVIVFSYLFHHFNLTFVQFYSTNVYNVGRSGRMRIGTKNSNDAALW